MQLFAFADLFVACESAETYSLPCWCTNGQLQETSTAQPHPIFSILALIVKPHESFIAWRLFPVYMAAWLSPWLQQGPAEGDAGCEEEVQSRSTACRGQSRAVAHLPPSCTTPGHAQPAQDCRPSRSVAHLLSVEKEEEEDCAFWCQFNEKPSVISGCPDLLAVQ